jgi:hypothetical protein
MKKKLLLFMVTLLALGVIVFPNAANAEDISDSESYTITIPEAVNVVLAADTTSVTLKSADWLEGSNNQAENVITLGDGTDAATSYIQTNDPTTTNTRTITMTVASAAGDTVAFSAPAGDIILTLTDAAGTGGGASAEVICRTSAGADTDEPTIGDSAATTKDTFAFTNATTLTTDSSMTNDGFDSGNNNKAPLDFVLDLDESTLDFVNDVPGEFTFELTLTVAGVGT